MGGKLIVNADDFGLTESVSRGIIRAHTDGILTSTTFMVNFPWAPDMAPLLRAAPGLGVGVHLNLTTGEPLLPAAEVPTLVGDDGRFGKSLVRIFTRADMAEVRKEWAAQVERAIALLGRAPTHLDTHRYLQAHPRFTEVLIEIARTYKIPAVRCLYPGHELNLAQMVAAWNPMRIVVERALRRSAEAMVSSGLKCPAVTLAGDFTLPGLLGKLDQVHGRAAELICHPGLVDDRLRALSSMQEHREEELAALVSPAVRSKVAELGIALITFADLV
ncbi:MAG TPA: ChbG/HpnK family deacetylase [Symbiobacteriaceae bacterium]|nr:ChbG/HpnK family deacetylase [Symbiobacteriaceae bacterium]